MKSKGSRRAIGGPQRRSVSLSEEIVLQVQQWADDNDTSFSLALEVLAWGGLFEECGELRPLAESKDGRCALAHVHECVEKALPNTFRSGKRGRGF